MEAFQALSRLCPESRALLWGLEELNCLVSLWPIQIVLVLVLGGTTVPDIGLEKSIY